MTTTLKCKICGGDIDIVSKDIAVCQYCGSKQILPKMTSERKANLYDRANHYRSINEFDKAVAVYEQVLAEDDSDAEVYWDLVLCRYGIEYVEDPRTKKRIPTVNRTQFQSIFDDRNYLSAIEHASDEQKEIIKADAEVIDRIQKGILDISNKEKPYDIFICYKETDNSGRRTPDSVIAQDMYDVLSKEGYKVFFSRITLEDKLGSAYEPYIFAALNSAKVMIAVGTKPEHFNAVWVKNEWSRYLGLISAGEKKTLIPAYKDMDPYELPEEFSHLQAQDMGKLGSMQDLVRGVKKIHPIVQATPANLNNIDTDAYKTRIEVFLDNGDFGSAKEYCDKVLDIMPKDAETYILKLCADMNVKSVAGLGTLSKSFRDNPSYQNAVKFGTSEQRAELEELLKASEEKLNSSKKRVHKHLKVFVVAIIGILLLVFAGAFIINAQKVGGALSKAEKKADEGDFKAAYEELGDVDVARQKDSKLVDYILAGVEYQNGNYDKAAEQFSAIVGYKSADMLMLQSRYKYLSANMGNMDSLEVSNELEELVSAGIEDTDDLQSQINANVLTGKIEAYYKTGDYQNSVSQLKNFKYQHPEEAAEYIDQHQSEWYDKALELIDGLDANARGKNYSQFSDYMRDIISLFEMCDASYKDAELYYKTANAGLNSNMHNLWGYVETCPLASDILWIYYGRWFYGTWKTSDGAKYFTIDENGSTSYNLPWFDSDNTYYDINTDGIYYLYDINDKTTPPATRKDMFKFEIINKDQIKVHCYKDNSDYMLYKE